MKRFWDKVDKSPGHGPKGECWVWTAAINKSTGYGAFKLDGSKVDAHRLAYELQKGAIPDGQCVCHDCDYRSCVRGSHLWLGTKTENNQDMIDKGRFKLIPGNRKGQFTAKCPSRRSYDRGCRCSGCRAIQSERMRRYHEKTRPKKAS